MADILQYLHTLNHPAKRGLLELFMTMPEPFREHCTIKNLKKGVTLVRQLDSADFVYVLVQGRVQTVNQDFSGNTYIVAEFTAPSLFGEFELIAGCRFYRGTLVATSNCQMIVIGREIYLAWIQGNAAVLFQRARAITLRLLGQSSNERNVLSRCGIKRLMFLLCQYYERNEKKDTVCICTTRQEMANEINTSVKTVGRGIQQLKKYRLIYIENGKINVHRTGYEKMQARLKEELLSCPTDSMYSSP
jgi:CRP-like cAMP-binding protein